MNIILVAPHQWRIPAPAHTGVMVVLDLAIALQQLGHSVKLIAPEGTEFSDVLPMPSSGMEATPTSREAESYALSKHAWALEAADIIHDFSVTKLIAEAYPRKSVSTVMSGNFSAPSHGRNVVVWSKEMQQRAYRGASDYEGTEFTQWHSVSRALADCHVVPGGVDTEFWTPGDGERGNHLLWLGRYHPARGYRLAIDLARANPDIELAMAGEAPGDALNAHQAECAMDAVNYATGLPNVRFEWLPKEGHREAVREQYRKARAYLFLPLFHEPFGLSQVEAMACGTPVIATEFGSTKEVVGAAEGCVYPPHDPRLVVAVNVAAHAKDIVSEHWRDFAVRNFDRSVMAKAYLKEYELVRSGNGWG